MRDEEYDFLSRRERLEREPVQAFLEVLRSTAFREALGELAGFAPDPRTGEPIPNNLPPLEVPPTSDRTEP